MNNMLSAADATVSAGAFNKPIIIQKYTLSTDSVGSAIRTWHDYIHTMARIEPWKGSDRLIAQQFHYTKMSKIVIRYRPSEPIDASMRILYKTRVYTIHYVMVPAEALTTIEIIAQELLSTQGSL